MATEHEEIDALLQSERPLRMGERDGPAMMFQAHGVFIGDMTTELLNALVDRITALEAKLRDEEFFRADAQRVVGLRDGEIARLKEQLHRIVLLAVKMEDDEMLSLQLNISRRALERYGIKALDDVFNQIRYEYTKVILEGQRRYR